MKETKMVRFPNESCHQPVDLDMSLFEKSNEFDDEFFGWYDKSIYISILKDRK